MKPSHFQACAFKAQGGGDADEPLSNLDTKLRVQMRGEIKAMHQKAGTTSIYD